MARFDESKVINALHTDKAEVGKKYWYSDSLTLLKKYVEENDNTECIGELEYVKDTKDNYIFHIVGRCGWNFLYPYEEPAKERMTNRMLAEWSAKGNGEFTSSTYGKIFTEYLYLNGEEDSEVELGIKIRHWNSDEWVEPTVDIYERDCKGRSKV